MASPTCPLKGSRTAAPSNSDLCPDCGKQTWAKRCRQLPPRCGNCCKSQECKDAFAHGNRGVSRGCKGSLSHSKNYVEPYRASRRVAQSVFEAHGWKCEGKKFDTYAAWIFKLVRFYARPKSQGETSSEQRDPAETLWSLFWSNISVPDFCEVEGCITHDQMACDTNLREPGDTQHVIEDRTEAPKVTTDQIKKQTGSPSVLGDGAEQVANMNYETLPAKIFLFRPNESTLGSTGVPALSSAAFRQSSSEQNLKQTQKDAVKELNWRWAHPDDMADEKWTYFDAEQCKDLEWAYQNRHQDFVLRPSRTDGPCIQAQTCWKSFTLTILGEKGPRCLRRDEVDRSASG